MVTSCAACRNCRKKGSGGISYHKFPLHDPQLLAKWMLVVKRGGFIPTHNTKLCSAHFDESCFWKSKGKRILKQDAIPHTPTGIFNFPNQLNKVDMEMIEEERKESCSNSDTLSGPSLGLCAIKKEDCTMQDSLTVIKTEQIDIEMFQEEERCSNSDTQAEPSLGICDIKTEDGTIQDSLTVIKTEEQFVKLITETSVEERAFIGNNQFKLHCHLLSLINCSLPNKTPIQKDHHSFVCEVCNKEFTRRDHFETHRATHNGERSFFCDVCNKGFIRKSSLKLHKVMHSGERSFVCDVCNKRFARKSGLREHKHVHIGDYSHVCVICNKGFTRKSRLKTHMIVHIGERLFPCAVCNKRFTRKPYLKTHQIVHAPKPSYVCDVCKKTFSRKNHLTQHELIRDEHFYDCKICKKPFCLKEQLKAHRVVHRYA